MENEQRKSDYARLWDLLDNASYIADRLGEEAMASRLDAMLDLVEGVRPNSARAKRHYS